MQIHPDIQKLVYAQAWQEIRSQAIRLQIFFGDVEIALKWRYPPSERPIRQQQPRIPVPDSYVFHCPDCILTIAWLYSCHAQAKGYRNWCVWQLLLAEATLTCDAPGRPLPALRGHNPAACHREIGKRLFQG